MAAGRKNRMQCELCSRESALRCEADCANLCTAICGASPRADFSLCGACSEWSDSRQNTDMKVISVLKRWYKQLNLTNPCTVSLAMKLVEKGRIKEGKMLRRKLRVYLAAALWSAATICENEGSLPCLKRFEECTGIAVKLLVLARSRLCSSLDLKMTEEGEDDSAECSSS